MGAPVNDEEGLPLAVACLAHPQSPRLVSHPSVREVARLAAGNSSPGSVQHSAAFAAARLDLAVVRSRGYDVQQGAAETGMLASATDPTETGGYACRCAGVREDLDLHRCALGSTATDSAVLWPRRFPNPAIKGAARINDDNSHRKVIWKSEAWFRCTLPI